jgi:hypothetical protein
MVTTSPKVCNRENRNREYLGDSGVLFFCFFRNFKAVLMGFVFKASIQIFSFRSFDFVIPKGARPGPAGPVLRGP